MKGLRANRNGFLSLMVLFVLVSGCREEVLPKPKAELRLEYEKPSSAEFTSEKFTFHFNGLAQLKEDSGTSLILRYPKMKGEIFINYKEVQGNLDKLLSDAQKFSYEHSVKADGILEQPFINRDNKVYGMFYEVNGDAASQAQFYVTDSTRHFVTGSLYFYTKPNYDSIYPAAVYLRKDIRAIMETLKWKE